MGKGLSHRRRQKAVVKANEGNLHKASLGKVRGQLFNPLPDAPKADDLVDKVPSSLKKLMELKAAAEKPKALQQTGGVTKVRGNKFKQATQEAKQRDGNGGAASKPAADSKGRGAADAPAGLDRSLVENVEKKGLKQKKKDYLNRKKLKKKGKLGKEEPTTLEKIMQDKAKVRFGEQADAPLEINLKRKHWTKEKTASERCKEVFLKQLNAAQQREAALRHGLPDTPQPVSKKVNAMPSNPAAQEQLRLQVIDAYRAQKKGTAHSGATMASLAKLVKTGSAAS